MKETLQAWHQVVANRDPELLRDILAEDCPWMLFTHRSRPMLAYDWVGNLKPSAVLDEPCKYLRVDPDRRASRLER